MSDEFIGGIVCRSIVVVVFFVWMIMSSDMRFRTTFEAEAVKHNAATWTVDENGNRVFKWKGE